MGKLDELMRTSAGIASESMGRPTALTPMTRASGPAAAPGPDRLQGITRSKAAAEIPLGKIGPDPAQPREEFEPEALARLAESMKARGQLQPIRVRWDESRSLYAIICGERRWRAAGMAGMATVSAVIVDGPMDPAELLAVQLVENALREDLKPIEQAKAFRSLMDLNGWSTHQVARELAVDQSSVVRALALLELPAAVQAQVEQGALAPATAYEVSKLDDAGARAELAARVVAEGLSRAETVEAVRRASGRKGKGRGAAKGRKVTARVFRSGLGAKVTVEHRRGITLEIARAALADAMASLDAEATMIRQAEAGASDQAA
jgi:ParB family chromosome partitioning protein